MKKLSILTLLIFILLKAQTQTSYEPGYMVTYQNDTIKGLINNKQWAVNPHVIKFKSSIDSQATMYNPLQIKYFSVGGDKYLGKVLEVDKSPFREVDLISNAKPLIELDTVFLTVLTVGRANLYSMIDEEKKEHYFIEKDTVFKELVRRVKKITDQAGTSSLRTTNLYIGLLKSCMEDKPGMEKKK